MLNGNVRGRSSQWLHHHGILTLSLFLCAVALDSLDVVGAAGWYILELHDETDVELEHLGVDIICDVPDKTADLETLLPQTLFSWESYSDKDGNLDVHDAAVQDLLFGSSATKAGAVTARLFDWAEGGETGQNPEDDAVPSAAEAEAEAEVASDSDATVAYSAPVSEPDIDNFFIGNDAVEVCSLSYSPVCLCMSLSAFLSLSSSLSHASACVFRLLSLGLRATFQLFLWTTGLRETGLRATRLRATT